MMTARRGRIFGYCHKCPHNAIAERIRNGDAVSEAERKRAADACAACHGASDDSRRGISLVSLSAMPDAERFLAVETNRDYAEALAAARAAARETAEPLRTYAPPVVEYAMREFLENFARMSLSGAIALHAMLNGRALTDTARETGRSKQALSQSFQRECRKFPALASISPALIRGLRAKSPKNSMGVKATIRTGNGWK